MLDRTRGGEHVGDSELRDRVFNHVRPHVHAFGHIHEEGGKTFNGDGGTIFVNAAKSVVVVDVPARDVGGGR